MRDTEGADTGEDALYRDDSTDEASPQKSVDQEEAQDMAETGLVPLKVLQGHPGEEVKPGDEIVVQVVKVYDDQAQIKYAPHKPGEEEGEGAEEKGGVDDYAKDFEAMSAGKE